MPNGILTESKNSVLIKIVNQIEKEENHLAIELGFFILELSEDYVAYISKEMKPLSTMTKETQRQVNNI